MTEDLGFSPQEIEFTFESENADELFILQTRDQDLHQTTCINVFSSAPEKMKLVGRGIGIGGSAMNGIVAIDKDDLLKLAEKHPGEKLILVRPDTVPDDIGMIFECDGLLTAKGGATSHAAVTAVRLGKTCVVNCVDMTVNDILKECTINGQLFKPGDDPESDEPELAVGFKLSTPVTEVKIGGAPTFDELVGSYEDGTMTITSVFISDTLRAELEKPASSEDSGKSSGGDGFLDSITDELNEQSAGCDIADVLLGLEEQIGVAKESPFTLSKTGENVGILPLNDSPGNVTYDPTSGILKFNMNDAELKSSMSGELRAGYNGDKSGVVLSGELKMTALFPESDFYVMLKLDGSKSLKP
ncbi:MAG: hypothetical protein EOM03_15600 [Clostridia bacterium]|nr:hypothetical protein [Clostridia bacterium]